MIPERCGPWTAPSSKGAGSPRAGCGWRALVPRARRRGPVVAARPARRRRARAGCTMSMEKGPVHLGRQRPQREPVAGSARGAPAWRSGRCLAPRAAPRCARRCRPRAACGRRARPASTTPRAEPSSLGVNRAWAGPDSVPGPACAAPDGAGRRCKRSLVVQAFGQHALGRRQMAADGQVHAAIVQLFIELGAVQPRHAQVRPGASRRSAATMCGTMTTSA